MDEVRLPWCGTLSRSTVPNFAANNCSAGASASPGNSARHRPEAAPSTSERSFVEPSKSKGGCQRASGMTTGIPRETASSVIASLPSPVLIHSSSTARSRSTGDKPPVWSGCPCEATTRSRCRIPRLRSHNSTESPGGPPSTSQRRPSGSSTSAASPWPMSRKVIRVASGGRSTRTENSAIIADTITVMRCGHTSRRVAANIPTGPTAGVHSDPAVWTSVQRKTSTVASASGTRAGRQDAGAAAARTDAGITANDVQGIASKFAIGLVGAYCWNHHALAGSVPTVAPAVVASASPSQESGRGRSGGSHFRHHGVTRTRPRIAPNDS